MKATTTISERIAVRAYFAWLNGHAGTAEHHWLEAETIEKRLDWVASFKRRSDAAKAGAKKAAATRKAKTAAKAPVAAIAAKRKPSATRATAH